MKKILSIFINPWVIGILGFLALAFIIWFFSPLLAFNENYFMEPENRRLILIGAIAVLMIARALWKKFRSDKANTGIVDGIVESEAPETPDEGEEEVGLLKERFEDAVKLLKKSGDGKTSLYEMPWYIIIGPPGSGKTTALVNSGLEFPLADQFGKEALQGVGGTRNCDWWFTNEAVLLDTAGRYTTQDSDAEVDSTAWFGFLDLLKRHRKRRPINGVFVAISVQDLLTLSDAERAAHAASIKTRVQELYERFGIRFPVYVMLTKSDLMNGFMEYFDDLGQGDREQVWGFTLPLLDQNAEFDFEAAFSGEYDALVNRLNDRVTQRLHQEQDVQRRGQIFGFPRQVAALKPVVNDFLMKIFKPSRYDPPFMWRGMYFTSGTQEGTPIDRLMGSMARTFGLERQSVAAQGGQGRSYFIADLLQKVAFTESELAGTNRRLEIQRAWLQRASYAAVLVLAVVAIIAWTFSYLNNRELIAQSELETSELQETAANLGARQNHPLDALELLTQAEQMPGGYAEREKGTPWLHGFGLYQGKRIGRAAENAYIRLLGNTFLPRVMLDQEVQLRRGWDNPEMLFNALKAYLMLDHERYDPLFVRTVWKVLWEDDLPTGTTRTQMDDLNRHALALVNNMPGALPEALDEDLIERARRDARRITPAERVYARVRQRASADDLEPFTVRRAAGNDAGIVFRRKSGKELTDGIDGLYTYTGYHQVFDKYANEESQDLDSDSWVLGEDVLENVDTEKLADDVLNLYLSDYEEKYASLLSDLTLIKPSSLQETVRTLRILSHPQQSPLKKLALAVVNETTLQREEDEAGAMDKISRAAKKARALEQSVESKIRSTTGRTGPRLPRVSMTPRQRMLTGVGTKKLGKLGSMTDADGGDSLFDEVLQLLDELYVMLDEIEQSSDRAKMATEHAGKMESVSAELSRKTRGQDPMVAAVVNTMVGGVKGVMAGSTRSYLNDLWRSDGYDRCYDTIAGRYPFERGASREIKLDDFGDFFGNGGDMDSFFSTHLKDYVDTASRPWKWKAEMRGASTAALAQFERAERIRKAYFRRSGSSPQVRFGLKPMDMDRSISKLVLVLGDSRISYDHGPTQEVQFSWPGQDSSAVRIELTPQSPAPSARDEDGDWGWFRLLESATMRAVGGLGDSYEVTFSVGSRQASFELDPKSSYNPFELSDLSGFSCPERL
ncbi:MAG: type VI secretion system membrane subunit TssM [Gammaproteobacteria bacterium]|nr:type VI secretion system membrane subunit TssM [Gammaproteobacteria bacterium]